MTEHLEGTDASHIPGWRVSVCTSCHPGLSTHEEREYGLLGRMEPVSRESELLVHQHVDAQLVSHCKEQIEQHGSPDDLKTRSKDREVFTAHGGGGGGRIDQE